MAGFAASLQAQLIDAPTVGVIGLGYVGLPLAVAFAESGATVIGAASTKPFGYMPFHPGPGLGGHCLPSDPHYLSWRVRLAGYDPRFIGFADEINSHMPDYVVQLVADALNDRERAVRGARILVLGVAYKADIADTRDSPALEIIAALRRKGARVAYHDPLVPEL
ncbi:MAG TPA: UDP binding domain-containing protein, partial [Methylomirabilota bacterium]|nr:UDP binding domain-containing protein [Methylomirabilota bacterium]